MPIADTPTIDSQHSNFTFSTSRTAIASECYHCGAHCISQSIAIEEKVFCCEGCKLVYEILDESGLCDYYKLQNHPGLSQIKPIRKDKFAYLDDNTIAAPLFTFTDGNNAIITLYIPGIHCASCMWLLEHMNKLNDGISESRLNFSTKEITIHFQREKISLRKLVELLATIGYEPYISLDDSEKKLKKINRKRIYKLGVAGFCFGNIMMMCFPEYLSIDLGIEHQYANLFRYLNLLLSIPVFFYSATEFYEGAWAGIKQKMLNIDAPIVLAVFITYSRSLYEILSGSGGGYLDSMSGIVFFMLVGRVVQERTYKSISFHRDYKSYFPIAVTVMTEQGNISSNLQDLKEKDVVLLHNDEIIPADALLIKGKASIDYSFVTGESEPVQIKEGSLLYAGGKQVGEQITIQVVKPVAGSYLTSLWNHFAFTKDKIENNYRDSIIHKMSIYFTYVLLALCGLVALYWWRVNPVLILPSVSAMLIIACPCALLLAVTYTNGNLLRIFSNNGLFLRDATIIEQIGKINHIVFDKTGTLTQGGSNFQTTGHQMDEVEKSMLFSVVKSSTHPYSKSLTTYLGNRQELEVNNWKEYTGQGVVAEVNGTLIKIGSASFLGLDESKTEQANVYVQIGEHTTAFFIVPDFRPEIPTVIPRLSEQYELSLISGDNDRQKIHLQQIFTPQSHLLFEQKPIDKLQYVEQLQSKRQNVMMVGDGLNDAGALQQSNVGITLADDVNNFTPSCDAILDAKRFYYLPGLLRLARFGKTIINTSFVVSILYNLVGLTISMQGKMSPMIAAILMPISTLSIMLISTGLSSLMAKRFGLSLLKEVEGL